MMLAEYSIWLLPEKTGESALSDLVARLAKRLGGTVFAPHVTVQGDLAMPLEELSRLTGALAERVALQRWRVQQVESSEHFFRCLYLRFGILPGFEALQLAVQAFTGTADGLSPFPHLSLAYGQAEAEHATARAELAREFAAQEIVLDRLAICRSSKNVPIADWSCLALYPLRQPLQKQPS